MREQVDLGDATAPFWPGSIHPRAKQQIAERLALEARRIAYGERGLLSRGPQLAAVREVPDEQWRGVYSGQGRNCTGIFRLFFRSAGQGLSVSLPVSPAPFFPLTVAAVCPGGAAATWMVTSHLGQTRGPLAWLVQWN